MSGPAVIGPGEREPRPRLLLRTTLGEILRRTRLAQRRTLADVARAARVSMPYLSELERGRKEASSEVLAAVCDALRIELSDLLAAAGRDLVGHRARRGQVVRLAAIRGHGVPPPAIPPEAAPPEAAPPEAARPDAAAQPQASVTAQLGVTPHVGLAPQIGAPTEGRGPGDVVRLLAA